MEKPSGNKTTTNTPLTFIYYHGFLLKDKIKRRNSKSKLRFVRSVKQELFPCIKIKAIIA